MGAGASAGARASLNPDDALIKLLGAPDLHELAEGNGLTYEDLTLYAAKIGVDTSELGTKQKACNCGNILALIMHDLSGKHETAAVVAPAVVAPSEPSAVQRAESSTHASVVCVAFAPSEPDQKNTESLAAGILSAITAARADPAAVAYRLTQRLGHFEGREYYNPRRTGIATATKEGAAAVKDAINYLNGIEPIGELKSVMVEGLALSAEDHVADIGAIGTTSHRSSDGTGIDDQCGRYGAWERSIGQIIWYGRMIHPTDVVDDLIVDDGVQNRGHRLAIYNDAFELAGVAIGPHKVFGQMLVVNFSVGFAPDADKIEARKLAGPPVVQANAAGSKITTQWKDLGVCGGCTQRIHGGRVVEVKEAKYHADCFACANCAKSLIGEKFQVAEKKLLCTPCWVESHAPTCKGCRKKIEGGVVNVTNSKEKTKSQWHKDCYEKEKEASAEGGGGDKRAPSKSISNGRKLAQKASSKLPLDDYAALGI